MTNHTLEKTQWLVATSLTFGDSLKFGQDSCHTAKSRPIPSSNERESTWSSTRTTPSAPTNREGPPTSPARVEALLQRVVERRPDDDDFYSDRGRASKGTRFKLSIVVTRIACSLLTLSSPLVIVHITINIIYYLILYKHKTFEWTFKIKISKWLLKKMFYYCYMWFLTFAFYSL